ncbi:MAG: NADH:ubiquinone reductase (Na(+)-transporting) subunit C [Prevotella sp.]|nr:NADH:ubiquinone reductase (Na(+)-transporting) subunit C [Bacteroides sp.]MCM1366688.1 NADH:ubiquinone reductase (Na(+)-transporting) subunit C [Prevotella sp.]
MNRESNTYTVIYSIVLVIVVGVALSLIYQALRPRQEENIANDTKKQILAAALITPRSGESISELYASHITDSFIVDINGDKIDSKQEAASVNIAEEAKKEAEKRLLPVFECQTTSGIKYIIPMAGNGLWGPIWGYIALDNNGDTVYGAYFAHQGETPGLGAEIEKPAFQEQFKGKNILNPDGSFEGIQVVKSGHEPQSGAYVHAISGGTITSQGVQSMLRSSLEPYTAFFDKLRQSNGNQTAQNIETK